MSCILLRLPNELLVHSVFDFLGIGDLWRLCTLSRALKRILEKHRKGAGRTMMIQRVRKALAVLNIDDYFFRHPFPNAKLTGPALFAMLSLPVNKDSFHNRIINVSVSCSSSEECQFSDLLKPVYCGDGCAVAHYTSVYTIPQSDFPSLTFQFWLNGWEDPFFPGSFDGNKLVVSGMWDAAVGKYDT
jgi:hypothetical protein